MYRQGDILLIPVRDLPEGGKAVKRDKGRLILAYGEVTGHAHAVTMPHVRMIETTKSRFLVSDKPFAVTHEEHDTVELPAGIFEVRRQREYSPEAIRQIAD